MSAAFRASVVVPTFNRLACVERLLRALREQTIGASDYEVIVSIDGSCDGTENAVRNFAAPYRLASVSGPNRGRAAACNSGLRLSVGQIIILLDDDMEPAPGFIKAHLSAHAACEHIGAMGAVPILLDDSTPPAARYIGEKFNAHLRALERPSHQLHFRDFYTGNFSIRRDLLVEAGGFDEEFRAYGNEDLELSWRLRQMGLRFLYTPQALAWQYYTKDFEELARDNVAKGRTAVLLASKHPETLPHLRLSGYRQDRLLLRLFRSSMLTLTRCYPTMTEQVITCMKVLERHRSAAFRLFCAPVLDYLFWVGALSARRPVESSSA